MGRRLCSRITLLSALLVLPLSTPARPTLAQAPVIQEQIAEHEQRLKDARTTGNRLRQGDELASLGHLYEQAGRPQMALDLYGQSLSIVREVGERRGEAVTLDLMGSTYQHIGQSQKAIDYHNQALSICTEIGDRKGTAATLSDIGTDYLAVRQPQRALEFFNQALPVRREVGDRSGEASTLHNIGASYLLMTQLQRALDFFNEALAIEREANDQRGKASNLACIGSVYLAMGQPEKALYYFQQALSVAREVGDRRDEAAILSSIGTVYSDIGQLQKAVDFLNQSLPIEREVDDPMAEAATLSSIANVYSYIGQPQKAVDFLNQSLPIERKIGDRIGVARTLNSLGVLGAKIGQQPKAFLVLYEALKIEREVGDRTGEATTLANLGSLYRDIGQPQKALDFLRQSMTIQREIGDRQDLGYTWWNIGTTQGKLGDRAGEELEDDTTALVLAKELHNASLEGGVETTLMNYFRDHDRPEIAILFGIDAVNSYQQIRKNMSGLDQGLQAGFVRSKSSTYRELAELLVSQNRLTEAEHVLDLLKDAELKETVRGAANDPAATTALLPLTDADRAAEAAIAAEATEAASLTDASFEFDRLNALPTPTEAEKAKLKDLSARIAAGNAAIDTFFNKTLYEQLGGDTKSNARASTADTETSSLSNLLAQLGPGTLALYTLVGDQHSYLIVTTPNTRTRYEIKSTAADLGKLILALRQELKSPTADPSKDLAALSHLLLDPIAADLATAARQSPDHIPTLLWSLDGVLRYVPMSALFDPAQPAGRQYLVERARNVIITPESRNHLLDAPSASLSAVGFGLSKSYESFPALSGVSAELNAVVHDPTVPASHGPLTGKLMRDDAFTLTALESNLRQHPAVVHIASHFVFQSGKSGESYLLLGGEDTGGAGYELTMSRLQTDPQLSFRGTRLLTLSACSTAEADTTSNGREIDSLGMVVQKRDAAAVLATLWDVNDASTSLLMSDFYRRWATTPNIEKIEALRQAQIALLEGPASRQQPTTARGPQIEAPASSAIQTKYSHPYFWAPFVLIGNYR